MSLSSQEHIELTMRTAIVGKSLMSIIGMREPFVIKLAIRQVISDLKDLSDFVDKIPTTSEILESQCKKD